MSFVIKVKSNVHAKKRTSCNAQVVTHKLSVHKLLTSFVRTACSKLLEEVWNKLLTTYNKLNGTIRLVTRLFVQD